MKRLVAEFLGTFGLVFAGTGAIVVNNVTHGSITQVGIALTFGLIVLAMIYTFGDVSGAHLNPAVTLAFAVSPGRKCLAISPRKLPELLPPASFSGCSFLTMKISAQPCRPAL